MTDRGLGWYWPVLVSLSCYVGLRVLTTGNLAEFTTR